MSQVPSKPSADATLFWLLFICGACIVLPGVLLTTMGRGEREEYYAIFAIAFLAGAICASLPLPASFSRRYLLVFVLATVCMLPLHLWQIVVNKLSYNCYGSYASALYLLGLYIGYTVRERFRDGFILRTTDKVNLTLLFLLPGLWFLVAYCKEVETARVDKAQRDYHMAVTCNPNAPPTVGENRRTVFSRNHFALDAVPGSHPPLSETRPSGSVEDVRLFTAREGECLKVGFYSVSNGRILSTHYVQAPNFDIQGMAASPLPTDTGDVQLENGAVLPRIRHGEAMGATLWSSNSKEGESYIRWLRIYGNYYYIEIFRLNSLAVNGIFTEKNNLDLRPYLGDSTQKLDPRSSGAFGADYGDTHLKFYHGDNNQLVQEVVLTPVQQTNLPPDFPPDAVYWVP